MSERVNDSDMESAGSAEPRVPGPPTVRHLGDSVTSGVLPAPSAAPLRPRVRRPLGVWLAIFAGIHVLLGLLAGGVWHMVVPLTIYEVNAEGLATTSERGLAGFMAGDAWFVIIGLVLGVVCGGLAWRWFAGLGWPVVPLVIASSTTMGLLCWGVGWLLGPGPLTERLAQASPGATLPIELTVRGHAATLVWPFAGVLMLMLLSSLVAEPEQARGEAADEAF